MHGLRNASLFSGRKFTQPNSGSSGGEEPWEKAVRRLSLFIVYLFVLFAFFLVMFIYLKNSTCGQWHYDSLCSTLYMSPLFTRKKH